MSVQWGDEEARRRFEEIGEARSVHGGMVVVTYLLLAGLLTLLILAGGLAAFTQWAHSAMLGVTP